MEYLDYYDESGKFLGKETREIVHSLGLWHKTIHCWLYDKEGNIYFQIRSDSHKLYTTASGHIMAGETVKEAFSREVFEEIGIHISTENAHLLEINVWKQDKIKATGPYKDRAFANVYLCEFDNSINNFKFDPNEVEGLIKVKAELVFNLLRKESGEIPAEKIVNNDCGCSQSSINLNMEDFLITSNEIGLIKYGKILQEVINITK